MALSRPEVVLIGAAGRNVGKTEFACRLIDRYAATERVFGVKITVIRERDGQCPRGGAGCGVCGSLKDNYCISRERDAFGEKDTSRMLQAGADEVLWLRVMLDHLDDGINALFERIPRGVPVVCESNSARLALDPGVFVIIREARGGAVKASANAVKSLADAMVTFHGDGWDLSPECLGFAEGRWQMKYDATAIVLAGGASSRMGMDKSLLQVEGKPLVARIVDQVSARFRAVVVGANDPDRYAFLGIPVIPDREPGKGPLMGIRSCLEAISTDWAFVTACDIPVLDGGLIQALMESREGADIVMPRLPDGGLEPLMALYRRSLVSDADALLAQGKRRIVALFERARVSFVDFEKGEWYFNLNTPDDVNEMREVRKGACSTGCQDR